VIIGGGAHVYKEDGSSPDNMLTALYPHSDFAGEETSWVASSKDHGHTSQATLEAWCVTAKAAKDDVYVGRAANAADTGVMQAWSYLPKEYELVSGGARAFYAEPPDAGALLFSCSPVFNTAGDPIGWYAAASDHLTRSPVAVEAYAVGISRDVLDQHKLEVVYDDELGPVANHRTAERTLERWITDRTPGIVVGGGVTESRGVMGGNFLTSSWPIIEWSEPIGWRASSQDHAVPSPTALKVTAFAIVQQQ
jgi:hypothetical protein